jgi:hypothetical protein
MSGSVGPLVTYNWNPSTQLEDFLADEAGVKDGTGAGATVAFLGDSTTDGFGTAASDWIDTTSTSAQVAQDLQADDGVAANQADFMGQGNELADVTDARVSLLGGTSWSFPMGAGGEVAYLPQTGASLAFTPNSAAASKSVSLDYYEDTGYGDPDPQLTVSVNGQNVGTLDVGQSGAIAQASFALPASEVVTNVTITDANGSPADIEGLTLASSAPSVQVIDEGVGGAQSSIVGSGQPATNGYNTTPINAEVPQDPTVAFLEYGINDVLQGTLTAAQTTANLALMIQELQSAGTEVVLVIPNAINNASWNAEIPTLRSDVDALAIHYNVGVIDLSATSGDNGASLEAQGLLVSDGVHPSAAYDAQVGNQIAGLLTAPLSSGTGTGGAGSGGTSPTSPAPLLTPPIVAQPVGVRSVITASTFLNSLGVDTHIPYTDGAYSNVGQVLSDLQYLGIDNVRDGISNGAYGSAPLSSFETLAQAGIKFTAIAGGGGDYTPASLQTNLDLIEQLDQAVPGAVEAVEGTNEINNQPVTWTPTGGATESGLQAAVDLQSALYTDVHSSTALEGVPVDYFTGYDAGSDAVGPNPYTTPGLADYDTQHPYPNSAGPAYWVAPSTALPNEAGDYGPAVYTETGYTTNSVTPLAQAQGDLDIYMDDAKNGVSQTYLYQLLDAYQPGSPQGEDGYGLFDPSGAAKPTALGIHDLTTILADTGTPLSNPAAAGFTVSGLPSDGNSLDIEKSDGTHDFVVWNETSGSQAVNVNLGSAYQNVEVFDPLQGATPIATYTDASSVALTLDDSPLIVQVGPQLAPVTPPAPPAPPTPPAPVVPPVVTIGSGPDTLALQISQDYYQGAAQFTVDVDGVQVGGTQTISAAASHASGTDQTFDVLGSFEGQHQVSVSFVNDLYAGTPSTDRNLYLDGASIDGTVVPNSTYSILGDSTETFGVGVPGTTTPVAPVLDVQAPDQRLGASQAFSFALPSGSYTDPDGGTVSYAAYSVNGSALPSWLAFDASNDTFTGTTPATGGVSAVRVVATTSEGASSAEAFHIYDMDQTPTLQVQEGDVRTTAGSKLSFTLPTGSFSTPSGETLAYSASAPGGAALPAWLSFNAATGAFSGTDPEQASTQGVVVTATTPGGAAAAEQFEIYTRPSAPVLQVQEDDQRLQAGSAYSFALPANSFSDPSGGAVTYTASGDEGAPLPSGVSFNTATDEFSGTVPDGVSATNVVVTAHTLSGGASAEAFNIYGQPQAPTFLAQAPDERLAAGTTFSFALPNQSYSDPVAGGSVVLSARSADLSALPSWISFNPTTDVFSGTTPGGSGSAAVRVDATTAEGGTAAEAFHVYFK